MVGLPCIINLYTNKKEARKIKCNTKSKVNKENIFYYRYTVLNFIVISTFFCVIVNSLTLVFIWCKFVKVKLTKSKDLKCL